MKKWSYLVLIVGWTLSMVYEALFVPSLAGLYALMAGLLDVVLLGLYAWELRKERKADKGTQPPITKGVYVAVCVLLCILLGLAIRQAGANQPPHVMFLPLYLVAIGCSQGAALWLWRKEKKSPAGAKAAENRSQPKDGK